MNASGPSALDAAIAAAREAGEILLGHFGCHHVQHALTEKGSKRGFLGRLDKTLEGEALDEAATIASVNYAARELRKHSKVTLLRVVYAPKTGKLRWRGGVGSAMMSAPAVASAGGFPVAVYAVSREGRVFCFHPQTGAVLWWRGSLPGYDWRGDEANNILCAPLVVTTPTATGSKRTIYIGAMTVDPNNPVRRHVALFKFEDVIGE